ncbi:MAG: PEGA domain-containing protein [Candidatus Sulfotelmatobacter sp.]
MSTKIGHFEILSELAKSATGTVYKANDPKSGQTVALKAIQLSAFGSHAEELGKCLLEESETTKVLSHPNLTTVFGAQEIDGQFCAAMEYIQGNSVATMLARKEGFSIWDLLDIGRQVCSGLDDAHSHKIFHHSLEPSKIMCGWDGTVRVLGYGLSSVGKFTLQMEGVPSILHYFSPEQVRGEEIDARSNFFSLGAMFYEMVTDRKAFDREDSESLRESIAESTPVPPMHLNPKLHPQLSDLIMRALAKDPGDRYQSGKELLEDLEKCKESKPQAAKQPAAAAPVVAAPKPSKPEPVKAVAPAKISAPAASAPSRPVAAKPPVTPPIQKKIAAASVAPAPSQTAKPPVAPVARKAAAAAAGAESAFSMPQTPQLDSSSQFITSCVKATIDSASHPAASMSSAVLDEPEVEEPHVVQAPKINVDPMMAEEGSSSQGGRTSFSEMTELPPLKEAYAAPTPAAQTYEPELDDPAPAAPEQEKPKVQPREVAEKAIKEIKNVPPRLMIYSIAGAAVLILIIAVALVLHVNTLNSDGDTRPAPTESTAPAAAPPVAPAQPAQPAAIATAQPPAQEEEEVQPTPTHGAVAASRGRNAKKKTAQPIAAIVVPGQMAIDSTPQGAQVQIDGKTDPTWVTPFTLSGLLAGAHTVTVSKAGYSTDTRNVDVISGSKSFAVSHLSQLMATLAVGSSPAGAAIFVDGKDSGKITPAQVSVDKGQHEVLLRKSGFIDETTNAQFVLGQTFNFSPTLRALGNVDDIKTVGKMKKLFGGKEAQGMGTVSIRTQPKGAQIAINQHMLEKSAPVDIMLDPGNYIVDISATGYAPVHKVITVDKGGKAVIDETLQRQ